MIVVGASAGGRALNLQERIGLARHFAVVADVAAALIPGVAAVAAVAAAAAVVVAVAGAAAAAAHVETIDAGTRVPFFSSCHHLHHPIRFRPFFSMPSVVRALVCLGPPPSFWLNYHACINCTSYDMRVCHICAYEAACVCMCLCVCVHV